MKLLYEALSAVQGVQSPLTPEERERLIGYIRGLAAEASDEWLIMAAGEIEEPIDKKEALLRVLQGYRDRDWRDLGAPVRKKVMLEVWPELSRTAKGRSFLNLNAVSSLMDAKKNIKKFL